MHVLHQKEKKYRPSATTKPLACRVPNYVYAVFEKRAERKRLTLGEYLREKLKYEATRPH